MVFVEGVFFPVMGSASRKVNVMGDFVDVSRSSMLLESQDVIHVGSGALIFIPLNYTCTLCIRVGYSFLSSRQAKINAIVKLTSRFFPMISLPSN